MHSSFDAALVASALVKMWISDTVVWWQSAPAVIVKEAYRSLVQSLVNNWLQSFENQL